MVKDKMKEYRQANGLTQQQVAETLGISKRNIANWEQGVSQPTVEIFISLCKLYGITSLSVFDEATEEEYISPREIAIIKRYRECIEYQKAVDKLLDI